MKNGYVLIELLVSLVLLGIATQISLTYLHTNEAHQRHWLRSIQKSRLQHEQFELASIRQRSLDLSRHKNHVTKRSNSR
jgi:prepilin-type N-terminal cleavage/methylation domain-containing protein